MHMHRHTHTQYIQKQIRSELSALYPRNKMKRAIQNFKTKLLGLRSQPSRTVFADRLGRKYKIATRKWYNGENDCLAYCQPKFYPKYPIWSPEQRQM